METSYADIADLLGLTRSASVPPLELIERIQKGLPVTTLYSVSHTVAPDDTKFVYRIVSKSSLTRRKQNQKTLTADESNRVARLANVWGFAERIWKTPDVTRAFFFRAHPILEGNKPIDVVLRSELGAELVKDILGRLLHGTAA